MDQVSIDVEQQGPIRLLIHNVTLKDFVVESLRRLNDTRHFEKSLSPARYVSLVGAFEVNGEA